MSNEYSVYHFDGATSQETIREATVDEIAEIQQAKTDFESQQNEQQTQAAARESALAKLADLGLTAEEIAAL
jgi:DNA-binding NarL/FixJ family response regulator